MDFLTIFSLIYMSSIYKVMGMQLGGYDDEFLTWVGSIGSLANGISRAVWGPMQDKKGFRAIYKVVIVIELIYCSLMPYIVQTNRYLYMLWIFMGFLCLGAHFVIFPNCIIEVFGLRSSVQLSSLIYISRCISALSAMFISKALSKRYGDSSYSIMFFSSAVLVVISALLLIFVQDETPIKRSTQSPK